MSKILEVVKVDHEVLGRVDGLKYFDHDVSDAIKLPDLEAQCYLESRG